MTTAPPTRWTIEPRRAPERRTRVVPGRRRAQEPPRASRAGHRQSGVEAGRRARADRAPRRVASRWRWRRQRRTDNGEGQCRVGHAGRWPVGFSTRRIRSRTNRIESRRRSTEQATARPHDASVRPQQWSPHRDLALRPRRLLFLVARRHRFGPAPHRDSNNSTTTENRSAPAWIISPMNSRFTVPHAATNGRSNGPGQRYDLLRLGVARARPRAPPATSNGQRAEGPCNSPDRALRHSARRPGRPRTTGRLPVCRERQRTEYPWSGGGKEFRPLQRVGASALIDATTRHELAGEQVTARPRHREPTIQRVAGLWRHLVVIGRRRLQPARRRRSPGAPGARRRAPKPAADGQEQPPQRDSSAPSLRAVERRYRARQAIHT